MYMYVFKLQYGHSTLAVDGTETTQLLKDKHYDYPPKVVLYTRVVSMVGTVVETVLVLHTVNVYGTVYIVRMCKQAYLANL